MYILLIKKLKLSCRVRDIYTRAARAAIPHIRGRPRLIQRPVVLQDSGSYFAVSTCTEYTIAPYRQEGGHVQLACLILSPALFSRSAIVLHHGRRLVSFSTRRFARPPYFFSLGTQPRPSARRGLPLPTSSTSFPAYSRVVPAPEQISPPRSGGGRPQRQRWPAARSEATT
jgi:hypothetical protein